jgi:hypothetical protein
LLAKKIFNHQLIALALCFCMITALSAGFPPGALASDVKTGNTGIPMSDISGHWAQDSIQNMAEKGIIKGYPDGTFRPGGVITRAEFVHLTVVALGLSGSNGKGFADTVGHWAEQSIKAAVEHEIIAGYSEVRFGPNDSITREQAAIILVKALGITSGTGKDFVDREAISSWAIDAVACASAQGIVSGYPDGSFKPQANVTRAQAAVILQRSLQIKGDLASLEPEEEEVYAAPASSGSSGGSSGGGGGGSSSSRINISAIPGLTVPVTGQTPVSTVTETAQYTGTVAWSPNHSTFEAATVYTATITLTAKSGYTLNGVTENFFTVTAATSVYNTANSGEVTAVFPATAGQITEKSVYDIIFDPTGIVAAQAKEVDITLKAVEVKDEGYNSVRVNVSVTAKPENSTVSLVGNYGAGPVDAIALGYWGPETGFELSADYDHTDALTANFSKAGNYTLLVSLYNVAESANIMSKTVNITILEVAPTSYTLTLTGDNISSDPVAGAIEENTAVTITVSPASGKQVASFTVGGVDKKAELNAVPTNQYTFSITADTIVVVSYEDIPAGSYSLNLLVSPIGAGMVSIDGTPSTSGTFPAGAQVQVGCMPLAGYEFVNWTVESVEVSNQANFDYLMPSNYTNLVANFISTATAPPPTLNADSTGNYAGQTLMITFSNGQAWANAITEISVDGEILSGQIGIEQYFLNTGDDVVDGQISLYGSKINALQSPGTKEIRVKSTGYADAVVMQEITATYFDRAEFSTQPVGPAENGGLLATQPIVKLYDQYDNPCIDGPSSTREITLQKASGDTWILGGTTTVNAVAGVATFTGLTATNPSGLAITDARLMYEVVGSPNQYFYSESFTIPGATGLVAPILTADATDNYAGNTITITLPAGDWADWLSAITAVKVGNDTLTTPEHYNIGIDNLILLSANITQLQASGTYTITVEAAGYNNTMVSQEITAGPQASAQFTTQPLGPAVSGGLLERQPVLTLYDTYGSKCADGPSSNASITLQRAAGDSWSLGGTTSVNAVNGVAAFTDLTASNPSVAEISDARMGYTFSGVTTYSEYFTVPGLGSQPAPALTADTTDNYAGNIIEITFTDNPTWRAAVNSIILGVEGGTNIQLFGAEGVAWEPGRLILDTSKIPGLQKRHYGHLISIAAPNYEATITYQGITSGIAASISIDTQPQGPAANGGVFQSAAGLSLFDAYNNQCLDGPSSSVAVIVEKADNSDWVLGGVVSRNAYQGSVTFGGLSAYNLTGNEITDAKFKFTVDGTAVTVDSNTFTIPPGSAGGAAPVFTPETENNYIGYSAGDLTITYPQNEDWTNQVINVGKLYLDGTELIQNDDYYLSNTGGVYYLAFYNPQDFFTEVRDYIIRIEAPGYTDAVIVQPITNGAPSYLVIDIQPGSPSASGELLDPQPVVKLYDKDDNLCTVMRGVFPGGASPQIVADKHENDASSLWYLAGTKTVDMVDGIATFTGLSAVSHNPDVSTEGLQVRFLLQLSTITAVSEAFTIPPQSYSLSLEANPAAGGTATIDGGGSSGNYTAGSPIAVTAAANADYAFVNWTVGGTEVSAQTSFTYTMPASDTILTANFQSTLPQAAPSLTPDTELNAAGFWIEIVFSYNDGSYGDAITAIEVDGVEYTNTEGQNDIFVAHAYAIELHTYNILTLQSRGTHTITVKADGYQDAVVTQFITAGSINGEKCSTLTGPESGQTYSSGQSLPPIKIQLKDRYGNDLTDGPDFGIQLTAEIPMGYGSSSTLSGILTAVADVNGQVTFNNIVVNLPDGVDQANIALKFTGTDGLGYDVTLYLQNPGTEDWTVFTIGS